MIENAIRQAILVLIVGIIAALCMWAWPINLGLDLKGGTQLIYEVDINLEKERGNIPRNATDSQIATIMAETVAIIDGRVNPKGITEATVLQRGTNGILIELPAMNETAAQAVERRIENLGHLEMRIVAEDSYTKNDVVFTVNDEAKRLRDWLALDDNANRKLVAEDPTKISLFHVLDKSQGGRLAGKSIEWVPHRIRQKPTNANQWARAETQPGSETPYCVSAFTPEQWNDGRIPEGLAEDKRFLIEFMPINMDESSFSGKDLDASGIRPSLDDKGRPSLLYVLKKGQADRYADWSEEYTGKRSAIILNGEVYSAPVFNGRIPGRGEIHGDFTQLEVEDLAKVLKTGSLTVHPIQQSKLVIGATLGDHSISLGIWSAIGGSIVVLMFILAYYRLAGLIAFAAIMLNIFLLFGIIAFIGGTLTLPGIAGLVLTMGMAVDANILIYERIREELGKGKELEQAVRVGFERAMVTILDANVTTFLAGLVLYNVGVGPIRGFAVTLMVGIITSLFTAFFVTRLLFHFMMDKKKLTEFKIASWFQNTTIDFLKHSKKAFVVSALLIIGGLTATFSIPSDEVLSLDFTGGASLRVVLKEKMTQPEFTKALKSDSEFAKNFPNPSVNIVGTEGAGSSNEFGIRLKLKNAQRSEIEAGKVKAAKDGTEYKAPYITSLERIFAGKLVDKAFNKVSLVQQPENPSKLYLDTQVHFSTDVKTADLQTILAKSHPEVVVTPVDAEAADKARNFQVEYDVAAGQTEELILSSLSREVEELLDANGEEIKLSNPIPDSETIGGRMVDELRNAAIGSLVVAMFLIVMFIRIRFHEYKYGIAAVCALVHDVLVTLGFVVLANHYTPLQAELSLAMIAAFLTIIGYSINDTIVIFDRVRENYTEQQRLGEKGQDRALFNRSINQTLSRTILTTFTTLFVVLVQFVVNFGEGSALEGFSFALLIGLVSGTYSTIFIASPVVLWLRKQEDSHKAAASNTQAA